MPDRGRLASALLVLALFLVPWAFWLSRTLPATHEARHWDLAWAGFDAVLALGLASMALSVIRHSPWLSAAASASGTLLVVDAWFDVLAAAEAAAIELLLAALCCWLVRDSEHAIQALCDHLRIRGSTPTLPPAGPPQMVHDGS